MPLVKFIFAVFAAFYLPGSFFLPKKTFKSKLNYLTSSIIIGLVLWGWQEFVFGYLSVRYLSYFYLAFFFLAWLFKRSKKLSFAKIKIQIDKILLLIVTIGVIIQIIPICKNGINFQNKGLIFNGCNTEDNLWHASLSREIIRRFPPNGPGLSDIPMRNYHYWSDMVIASLVRVFKLPLFQTQFQFFPLLISLASGIAIISLCHALRFSLKTTRLIAFFNYFGGDLIYLVTLLVKRNFSGLFKMSSLEDGARFLCNQPTAFSYITALGGLSLFVLWRKKKNNLLGLLSMLLLSSTIGFKIYTNLFFVPGILLLSTISFFKKRWSELFLFSSFFLFSLIIYLPTNSGAGGLVWTPFSIVNNFIVQPNLGLIRWEMARIIFFNDKKYLINYMFETVFTFIFLVSILGTKIFGFLQSPRFLFNKLGRELNLVFILGTFISLIGGIFFIQTTGGANTFNFLVSVLLFNSILAGLSFEYWQKKLPKTIALFLLYILILLTLPRVTFETINHIKNFLKPDGFLLTNEELKLYEFINQDSSKNFVVAIDPNHYLGRNSPYVSIFLNRPLLLSGNGLLKHFRLEVEEKEKSQTLIFKSNKGEIIAEELLANQIKYIFLYDNHRLNATESAFFTSIAEKNVAGTVLKVHPEKILKTFPELRPDKSL